MKNRRLCRVQKKDSKRKKDTTIQLRYDIKENQLKIKIKKERTKFEFVIGSDQAWRMAGDMQRIMMKRSMRGTRDDFKMLAAAMKNDALISELDDFVEGHKN